MTFPFILVYTRFKFFENPIDNWGFDLIKKFYSQSKPAPGRYQVLKFDNVIFFAPCGEYPKGLRSLFGLGTASGAILMLRV